MTCTADGQPFGDALHDALENGFDNFNQEHRQSPLQIQLVEQVAQQDNLVSGVNPRTGIAQRSDGAVMLLVIDGRQLHSQGATYEDMAEVVLEYGAVNAYNLDGGSSSMMWYQGDYVNHCASVVGIRPVPTTFLVLKEGVSAND